MASLVTILVAAVVIYQVLANDIRDHITEYATLKAMGHTNGFLSRDRGDAGPDLLARGLCPRGRWPALGLYRATEALANIPMRLTAANLGLVLLLTLGASFVSAPADPEQGPLGRPGRALLIRSDRDRPDDAHAEPTRRSSWPGGT